MLATDEGAAPAGFDPILGDAERLPVIEVIEEQLLLALPLVAMHPAGDRLPAAGRELTARPRPTDRQRPFANLRELLDKGER